MEQGVYGAMSIWSKGYLGNGHMGQCAYGSMQVFFKN